jgi:hypothetical protein
MTASGSDNGVPVGQMLCFYSSSLGVIYRLPLAYERFGSMHGSPSACATWIKR